MGVTMSVNNTDKEKKNEISFLTPIFLLFACSMGLLFFYQGLIPVDHEIIFLIIVGFGFWYAIASTIYKVKSMDWMYNIRSQLSITYFMFISMLFSMIVTTALYLSGNIGLLVLLLAVWALQLFFVYKLLMFYQDRINYLSDQYKQRIEDKIKKEMDQFIK